MVSKKLSFYWIKVLPLPLENILGNFDLKTLLQNKVALRPFLRLNHLPLDSFNCRTMHMPNVFVLPILENRSFFKLGY